MREEQTQNVDAEPVALKFPKPVRVKRARKPLRSRRHRSRPKGFVYVRCSQCKAKVRRSVSKASLAKRNHFCSTQCASKFHTGTRHPNWRGEKIWRGRDWPVQSKAAIDRDLHQCQICHRAETKHGHLPVDHIVPFRLSNTNALWNLLTACNPCHSTKTHVEAALLRGDRVGFVQKLTELGWPMDIVNTALETWLRTPSLPFDTDKGGKIGIPYSRCHRKRTPVPRSKATHCRRGHLLPANRRCNTCLRLRRGYEAVGIHNRIKTHCKNGHELSSRNLYEWTDGKGRNHRLCRACRASAVRRLAVSRGM